jgi:ribosomal protein L7Ae-like RNA K-turn-binding protein
MARITLEYNARNRTASRIIEMICSLDNVFKVKENQSSGAERTLKAIKEAEKGKVVICDSYEDYLKKTSEDA